MTQEPVGIELDGDVTPAELATATSAFAALIETLTQEAAAGGATVEWVLKEASAGSFSAAVEGRWADADPFGPRVVEAVQERWRGIADDVRRHDLMPYSVELRKHLYRLTGLINGHVKGVTFRVGENREKVTEPLQEPRAARTGEAPPPLVFRDYVRGALRGKVKKLIDEQGDLIILEVTENRHEHSVRCFPDGRWAEVLGHLWKQWVVVEGTIHRDQLTGRAKTITDITDVQPIEDVEPGAYRRAMGCVPSPQGTITPEQAVRRIRDAGAR